MPKILNNYFCFCVCFPIGLNILNYLLTYFMQVHAALNQQHTRFYKKKNTTR